MKKGLVWKSCREQTTLIIVINYHRQFSLPASSGMVSSSPDVPDVPSVKRITTFHTHVCSLPFIQCSMDI